MRVLIVLLCLLASCASAAPAKKSDTRAQRDAEAKALTALIKKNLPAGWKVTYKVAYRIGHMAPVEFPRIEIKRLKPTAMYSRPMASVSVPNPDEKPQKPAPLPNYELLLGIDEFLTVPAYRKLKAKKAAITAEMSRLATGLISGKLGYVPRNEEEARRVQRYEKLEQSLYPLPDYYWRHLSLTNLSDDLESKPDYELVIDAKVRQECKHITLKVLGLLRPYEKTMPSNAK